ncbi:20380_t:CDS:2 [Dentiscutata erythropus]|uniref:20380_t:CDS:1 n=1 Tax=Dentiscutata erythropus TaxID=1348616 RepID=A0A9N8ZRT9_9GLOM|nr:20380_t:CDS:2 [Dentiscutata erythropus]
MPNKKDFAKDYNNQSVEQLIKDERLSDVISPVTSNLNQMSIIDTGDSNKIFQFASEYND